MHLQFYLGRSGSGKTQRCLDDIVERLRENPSPQAPPLIWLLPEQATAQAEAALLRQPGLRGIMRARVFSFKRLAREVLVETGGAATGFLGDLGRQMLLRALAVRHRGELKIFGRSVKDTGFIARLAAAFGELARFRHSFEELDALRKRLEAEQRGGSLLARKLHDLVLLGRAYEEALKGRATNPDHFLDELSRRLERSHLVRGAEVWIDGFASLMPQELRAVEAILRQAATVRVSLLLDPAEINSLPVSWRDTEPTRLFAQTEETYQRLHGMALDIDAEILDPLCFPAPDQSTRFSDHPGLDGLEKHLVSSGMTPRTGNFREALLSAGEPLAVLPAELPPALLVEAPNRRAEVETVARAIRRLAREEGYRWRDIAVVARDLEPYDSLIRSTFARYGIPCFFDRRRALTHHPLVELLRSSVRAVASDWAIEDVTHYLKTDFAPVSRHEVDLLENDALKRGIRGRRWWLKESADEKHTALNAIRHRALTPLNTLHQNLTSTPWGAAPHPAGECIPQTPLISSLPPTGRLRSDAERDVHPALRLNEAARWEEEGLKQVQERVPAGGVGAAPPRCGSEGFSPAAFAQALTGFMEMLKCGEALEVWAEEAKQAGDLDLAGEHAQVWESILALLREMEDSLGQEPMQLPELMEALEAGLAALTLSLPPPALDQTLVGTIERSRQPELHALFAIGLNEKFFPALASEDVIFSDADRAVLLEAGDFELAPPSTIQLYRERYLGYVAFTRASQRLWISWPAAGEDGKEMRPSAFVHAALEALLTTQSNGKTPPGFWAFVRPAAESSANFTELELPGQAVEGILRTHDQPDWQALEQRLAQTPETTQRLVAARRAWQSENRLAALDESTAPLNNNPVFSVSRLETFAQCPFRYFSQYMLSLREREVFEIRPVEIGIFHHHVLRDVFQILCHERRLGEPCEGFTALNWGKVKPPEAEDALDTALARCREEFFTTGALDEAQAAFLLERSRKQLAATLSQFIRQGSDDKFLQAAAEMEFGQPLQNFSLRGQIDRLDINRSDNNEVYFRIYDFKSSERELSLSAVLAGLSLQLLVYLTAAQSAKPTAASWHPAGAFYYPIRKKTQRLSAPPDNESPEDLLDVTPRGIVDGGTLDLFGPTLPGAVHPWLHVKLKKDGDVAAINTSDYAPPGKLNALCERAQQEAARLAGEIQSRHIIASPSHFEQALACDTCDYADVCRADLRTVPIRRIPSAKREEIFATL